MRWLSVVMPVRNEAEGITQVLAPLQALRDQLEIIVVDGGSTDATAALAAPLADKVLSSAPGRAPQMNTGAAAATGEVLLFLHADTQLPEGFLGMVREALAANPHMKSTTPLSSTPKMDPRVREDDVGGEREVFSPGSSLSKNTVIPAHAGIQADGRQAREPNREHSAHPHPTMDLRVREDDVAGESGASVPGTARASNPVIPAYAGIQADGQQAQEPNREHSAHPHPTMDPRVREDDVGGEREVFSPGSSLSKNTVIPAHAGIHFDLYDLPSEPKTSPVIPAPSPVIPAHAGIHFDLGPQHHWGRFDVRLAPSSPTLRLVAWMMNQRSRVTGICTGDQALFVRRDLFNRLGGYADIPLMEDIELSKRLKRISPPACIPQPLTTSSRRWQTRGVLRTIVLMWWLRLQYWAGVSPAKLVKKYYPARPSSE